MPWTHITGHHYNLVFRFSLFRDIIGLTCATRHPSDIESIELNLANWNGKHFHERLTPEFPDDKLQNKEYQTPSKGHLIWRHCLRLCSISLPKNLDDASRKCLGSVSIFSPDDFVFIAHSPGAPMKEKHSIFCICWERYVLSAFFLNRLDKLITQNIIFFFFFLFLFERVGCGGLKKPH